MLLLFGQPVANRLKTGWRVALKLHVLIALLSVMSDRPNRFAILPAGGTTYHNVLIDEAGDNFTAMRQATHFVVRKLVPSVNDQIPTAW